MKTFYLLTSLLAALAVAPVQAQPSIPASTTDSLSGFDQQACLTFFQTHHSNPNEFPEFLGASQRAYIRQAFFSPASRPPGQHPLPQQACTNIDFESGNLNGWTTSTGFNPGFNAAGCCLNAGGAQQITAAGTDACGGFPTVAPGGNFSVRLGNNGTGGLADRLEQTFNVTASNANFTYRYAVVFEDPGHALADQPGFQIEMLDSSGNQIPCTFYNVAAGQNIPGFVNSATCANVVYKPWTNVSVDLTSYIGQNVTIRFTTYDCALGGHYAYAYIDGSCIDFNINQNAVLCQGSAVQLSAPTGFASYTWHLPDNSQQNGPVISTGLPGIYTLNMVTFTGCPGPTMTYTLVSYPKPNAYFLSSQLSACSYSLQFTNNSTISSGSLTAYTWSLGDGTNSGAQHPSHIYTTIGAYTVQLVCTSNMGCTDTAMAPVSISPLPVAAFTANTACLNSSSSFTNTSSVNTGSIVSYQWHFGNGGQSALFEPNWLYSSPGIYSVSLTVTSNNNCSSSVTQTVAVNALPVTAFSAGNVCDGQAVNYLNASYISGGSISTYAWDFDSDGTTDNNSVNPSQLFNAPGSYTTQLTVTSTAGCSATQTQVVRVHPTPVVQFIANSVCEGSVTSFTSQCGVTNGQIVQYNWNFGDGTSGNLPNPQHLYATHGLFNVLLTATSNYNCSSTVQLPVTVFPKPVVNFSSSVACFNQTTQFTNQCSILSGTIMMYQWDFDNDGSIDNTTANPAYVYPTAGIQQSRLVAVSNNNCVNQNINNVVVHVNPVADFQVPSACMPQSSVFSNTSHSSDGAITAYNWDFNGDNLTDNVLPNPQYNFAQAGNYGVKLEVQTQYGCTNTMIKSAYVNATPTALFSVQNPSGCPSLCVNFTNQSSIGNGSIKTYQWIFGDNTAPSYDMNPTHCYDTGNYGITLKAVSDSGCVGASFVSNAVQVYPAPIAGFDILPNEVEVTTPLVEVQDRSAGASDVIYHFSNGGSKHARSFSQIFDTDDAKTIAILQVVTNTHGCRDSIIHDITVKPAWVIYVPNAFTPNHDGLNDGFRALGVGIEAFTMQIFDRWGKMIFETEDINTAWDGSVGRGEAGDAKQEVYVWKVKVKDVNHNDHNLIGHVTLLK